ncbi:MAG: hypothetical protein ACK5HR_05570 [Mycoplasmatales bacterium]
MIKELLEIKYKSLIFKYSFIELDDKNKLTKILKKELLNDYSFKSLFVILSKEEEVFYKLVKVNLNQNKLQEEEMFFIFCRIYLEYILKKNKKNLEQNNSDNQLKNNGVSDINNNLNVSLSDKDNKEIPIDRKNMYGDDDDDEESVVAVYKRTDYLKNNDQEDNNLQSEVQIDNFDMDLLISQLNSNQDNLPIQETPQNNLDDILNSVSQETVTPQSNLNDILETSQTQGNLDDLLDDLVEKEKSGSKRRVNESEKKTSKKKVPKLSFSKKIKKETKESSKSNKKEKSAKEQTSKKLDPPKKKEKKLKGASSEIRKKMKSK